VSLARLKLFCIGAEVVIDLYTHLRHHASIQEGLFSNEENNVCHLFQNMSHFDGFSANIATIVPHKMARF